MQDVDIIDQAVRAIRARTSVEPRVLVVLGSGLAALGDDVNDADTIAYGDIPGFAEPTVPGHIGELVMGTLAATPVAVMKGKIFSFESAGINGMQVPIRAMRQLGVSLMFYSASVGSLMPEAGVGSLVRITDHINAMGTSPLLSQDEDRHGDRFVDLAQAYDGPLNKLLHQTAQRRSITLHQGIYGAVRGPAFETPAEVRMLAGWGVDVVGMSLVPEVLLARQCGMRVVAVANVTNRAVGMTDEVVDHRQTLAGAKRAQSDLQSLLEGWLEEIDGA